MTLATTHIARTRTDRPLAGRSSAAPGSWRVAGPTDPPATVRPAAGPSARSATGVNATNAAGLPASARRRIHPPRSSDVLRYCALRVIDDLGPLTGLDALNLLAPMARLFGETPPVFPLLHELEDERLVVATPSSPPRYAVTRRGRVEASRLREGVRARLTERLGPRVHLDLLVSGAF